ncbi:MAG: hypothetical protein A2V99_06890 [Spirochaetes bacterium RBG_16_67_19]|nr:MAG: hypothetical protein A2V99_06890 [Spirochaetes bacterium RBG_16_67_19]
MRRFFMKRKLVRLLLLLLAIGWLFYGVSCSLLGVSIEDRVQQFVSDMNETDRSDVYLNFHPDIFNMAGAQDPDTWETNFPVLKIPYTYSALNTSDPLNVTFTVINTDGLHWSIRFEVEKLDNDWMISEMYKDPGDVFATTLIIN